MTKSAKTKIINTYITITEKQEKIEKELNWRISTGRATTTIENKLETLNKREQDILEKISKDDDLIELYEEILMISWDE